MASSSKSAWDVVATVPDVQSAHVLLVLLRTEGVPAEVLSDTPLLGEARRCEIRVPSEMAHRARWLISGAQFTDAELTFLATGELGGDENAEN